MDYGNPTRGAALLEDMTEEMDVVFGATTFPWRVRLTQHDLDTLKDWDANHKYSWLTRGMFFERDGYEYIRAVENTNIPFILDYRIVIDNAVIRPVVELDDVIDPDVKWRHEEAFDRYWDQTQESSSLEPKIDFKEGF
jgi:hypothetical protein